MRRAVIAAMVAAALALTVAVALAQQPDVSPPTVTLTPDTATVGDRITLTITVEHVGTLALTGPTFGADFGGLELLDASPPATTQLASGRQRTTFVYTLAAFTTGAFTVPPLPVTWPGGSAATEPRTVTINSVLAPGDTSLRPLKPQAEIAQPAPSPVVPALVVAAFALLTAAGYVMYMRIVAIAPPAPAVTPVAPPSPPHIRARDALDALSASGLAHADPAEYYARLAATVRAYLSERFAIAAFAMTRSEIAAGMTAASVDRWPARLAANLLEQCESVEFAGFRPVPDRRASDLAAAYEIIALTAEAEAAGQPLG